MDFRLNCTVQLLRRSFYGARLPNTQVHWAGATALNHRRTSAALASMYLLVGRRIDATVPRLDHFLMGGGR
jgi:hypothetical protein